jgi:flagellar motility protein MotE (MotC chaperone)
MKKIMMILIIFLFIILGAGLFAAHQTGFINLNPLLTQIPGMESFVVEKPESTDESGKILISPIEKENEKLRKEKKDLEFKITTLEGEKTKLLEQVTELQTELTQLKIEIKKQKTAVLNAEELAAYYQEMKPGAVVRIMDNLDDEVVVTILPLLENKQTAEIIALMDPLRAATITQLLLDKEIQQ